MSCSQGELNYNHNFLPPCGKLYSFISKYILLLFTCTAICVMGQVESTPSEDSGRFVLVSNTFPEELQVDPRESRLISFGIDHQTSPNYKHKTLSPVTVEDARLIRDSFVAVGVICEENTHLYSASKQTENCTSKGMKEIFQKYASEVGESGLFLFHFSGHGVTVRNKEWGLAPADFDYSRDTYITAEVLGEWLNEINCVAKYIIFTLDCCYAGGIGKALTSHSMINRGSNLYVMSACMAHETSLVLGPLRNSVFTYFLSRSIRLHIGAKTLPIRDIFKECRICCECLTATLVMYNEQTGLQIKTMTPEMAVRNLVSEDSPDTGIGRFKYAVNLYNRNWPMDTLAPRSYDYLNSLLDMQDGPLSELERRRLLKNEVLETVLCTLMYSIASTEVACDTAALEKVKNPNLSITAFIQVSSTLDMIHPELEIAENVFFMCWLYYLEVLTTHKVKLSALKSLQTRLIRTGKFNNPIARKSRKSPNTASRGGDFPDSAEPTYGLVSLANV